MHPKSTGAHVGAFAAEISSATTDQRRAMGMRQIAVDQGLSGNPLFWGVQFPCALIQTRVSDTDLIIYA